MPLYEYQCKGCGHSFEQIVFHESDLVRCPVCQGEVQKLLSSFHYEMTDEVCGKLPKGEQREICTECKHGGGSCPLGA